MSNKALRSAAGGLVLAAAVLAGGAGEAHAQWPQWGGPNRNFTVEAEGLADSWPDDGPKQLWKKRLGGGYSSIVVDDGLLYTTYRRGSRSEAVVALDKDTGEIVCTGYTVHCALNGNGRPTAVDPHTLEMWNAFPK